MSSSQSSGVSADYKLLREWDEDKDEEVEEEDLNFSTYSNGSFRRSIIHDYISSLKADLSNPRGSSSSPAKYGLPLQGSRKGLLAAIGVGLVLMALLISVSIYATQRSSGQTELNQRLVGAEALEDSPNGVTLVDVLTGKYAVKSFNGTWVSGTEIQYMDNEGNVKLYDVSKDEAKVILSGELFLDKLGARPFEVTLSPDHKFAMIGYGSQRLYRHSITAKYAIYEFTSGNFYYLTPELVDQVPGNPDLLQLVEWSPSNNAVAFVYEHDVYYRAAPNAVTDRLSRSGEPDIYNGVADWVYEEEMFSTSKALWFSPDGSHIAFATFNDTNVQRIQFPLYGDPGMFSLYQYPLQEIIPYPKAGTPNPDVSLTVVNLSDQTKQFTHTPTEEYIGTVYWATNMDVVIADMNRAQNVTRNYMCSTTAGFCEQPFYTVNQANGWIDINTPLSSKTGKSFIFLESVKQAGSESSYRHIVKFNTDGTSSSITSGSFSVDSIQGWDEDNSRIFYSATGYNSNTQVANPAETHLYVINTGNSETKCLTCDISNVDSSPCRANSFSLSKTYEFVAHTCTGPGIPEATIRTVNDMLQIKITWVDNEELRGKLVNVNQPQIQDYDVPLASGFTAKARLWLPPNYVKGKKYPMLVDVYAGPGSQKITHRFGIDWGTSLATSRNVIYASIDGRGSGRQSDDLLFQLNRKLGTVEIEDQIAVAKWLLANNKDDVIDGNKTAIWGWSYGGYATAMVMGTDKENIYKCGISVAPVTSWVFYDTIYTERYMGLPTREDNLKGYNSSDVTNHVANFRTKNYYLIHGNADDNVHYQQSMLLSRALEKADILFRQQSYPDENHGLNGVRRHLYHSLEDFLFTECF